MSLGKGYKPGQRTLLIHDQGETATIVGFGLATKGTTGLWTLLNGFGN